jgi:hypothetical protein
MLCQGIGHTFFSDKRDKALRHLAEHVFA